MPEDDAAAAGGGPEPPPPGGRMGLCRRCPEGGAEQQPRPARYRCPACGECTCSAACATRHKAATGCTGKRRREGPVPRREYGQRHLEADYRFLEDGRRLTDTGWRSRPPAPRRNGQLPPFLHALRAQAQGRGVALAFLQPGMEKRKANTTAFSKKLGTLFWRVEWRFHGAAPGPACVDPKLDERRPLGEALRAHLARPESAAQRHRLRAFAAAGVEGLGLFLRRENCPGGPQYFAVDPARSLAETLRGKVVYEFPEIVVCLAGDKAAFQVAEEEAAAAEEAAAVGEEGAGGPAGGA